ncbi:MAG TPA: PRC-barrel domain-containing protein [Dehalococcoidia bacterium]|jgi:uncharacterized protein YrrD|nr:PRC-barrel domain-containing protein [Dehalococcoidia bacterium]
MGTRSANELMFFPVISTREGREVGRVKDVVFDPGKHELLGMMVSMGSSDAEPTMFLPRTAIHSIGDHAVTVDSEEKLTSASSYERVREVLDSGIHLKGSRVLTEDGDAIGKVDKILLDDEGRVAAYEVSHGLLSFINRRRIPPDGVISIGQDAVIVSAAYGEEDDDEDSDQHGRPPEAAGEAPTDGTGEESPHGASRLEE